MSGAERKASTSGIWACQRCGKLIDSDDSRHTFGVLRRWKSEAEERAAQMVAAGVGSVQPALELAAPWLEPEYSVLSFASTAVERVGRRGELAELESFLYDARSFTWWVWTGPAGVGKSRLGVELCRAIGDEWHSGFLREPHQRRLGALRPLSPTLAVVDYAAQRAGWLSDALLELATREQGPPIRVLVLEREASGPWWDRVRRLHRIAESSPIASSQYSFPRPLSGLGPDELRTLIGSVAAHIDATVSKTDVEDIAAHALRLDSLGSPLSAFLATLDWLDTSGVSAGRDAALRRLILRAEDRLTAGQAEPETSQIRRARLFSTSLGGNVESDEYEAAAAEAQPDLLPGLFQLPAETADSVLDGLRPDLVGELLVLDELGAPAMRATAAKAVVTVAARRRPDAFTAFVERAARDHPDHPHLGGLLDAAAAGPAWASLAVRVVPLLRRSDHPLVTDILGRLSAQQEASIEPQLRQFAVTAQFHVANALMAEGQTTRANAAYTTALATAEVGWPVSANLLNNRGITWLDLGSVDLATEDFTAVIESESATDEARACALNNRADQFAAANDFPAAMVDRTSLLKLADTSFDRRYIALSRRASERWATGDRRGAQADFVAILATKDIATEQKMETRLVRAELALSLSDGRHDQAVVDLRTVIASARNFQGVEERARELLAEHGDL